MPDQMGTALLRSLGTAVASAAAAAGATAAVGASTQATIGAAAAAFVTPLATRGGIEGIFDALRQANHKILPSDVKLDATVGGGKYEIAPVTVPFWIEIGKDRKQVLGMRSSPQTGELEYLAAEEGGKPEFYPRDKVDQVLFTKPYP
jgi:hypothetical protein